MPVIAGCHGKNISAMTRCHDSQSHLPDLTKVADFVYHRRPRSANGATIDEHIMKSPMCVHAWNPYSQISVHLDATGRNERSLSHHAVMAFAPLSHPTLHLANPPAMNSLLPNIFPRAFPPVRESVR